MEQAASSYEGKSKFVLSIQKNWKGMVLMFISALITAMAQFIWKVNGTENLIIVGLGVGLYGLSSVLMIVAFRFGSLSVVHPIMALSYGFGLMLSAIFLREVITPIHIFGVLIIMLGVVFIGGGDA